MFGQLPIKLYICIGKTVYNRYINLFIVQIYR